MKILKKSASLLLAAVLAVSLCASAFAAGLDNFQQTDPYQEQFTDIGGWYADYVIKGYELGLIDGTSDSTYSPHRSMTVAEAVKLAACIHSIYTTGSADFTQGSPWWQVYADYCLEEGIIDTPYSDYGNAITRSQAAVLFAAALPAEALTEMNPLSDGAIPDVRLSDSYGHAVYTLYRAGVLTGDSDGSFYPDRNISRSEMAAIVVRMVDVTERQPLTFPTSASGTLTAEGIYAKCSPSVFSLTTYNDEGEAHSTGSGVFLSADGLAVSNWHIFDGAASATATTTDGETYEVTGIYDYDTENDLLLLQIGGTGFTPIAINDSGARNTGATVYAIGNPQGLENSMSAGIISAAYRVVNDTDYIQVTTPISSGSSGGALINTRGELIGITSASVSNGQNLNLAVPIEKLSTLDSDRCRSVSTVVQEYIRTLADAFSLSKTSVRLHPGDSITVNCSIPGVPNGYSVAYETSTRSIVQCAWGEWKDDDSVDLTLTGQNLGDVTVTISLRDRQENVLATRTIEVAVR